MNEIFYIAGIDARPWKKTPKIGAAIPLVLFFAAVEALRKEWNVNPASLPETKKYFVIIFLVVCGIYISKYFKRPWRERYTKKFLINLIYLVIISAGLYNALAQIPFINAGLVEAHNLLMRSMHSNTIVNVIFAAGISSVGIFYLLLRTWFHVRSETAALSNRSVSSLAVNFRLRERRYLILISALYFCLAIGLISFLTIEANIPSTHTNCGDDVCQQSEQ